MPVTFPVHDPSDRQPLYGLIRRYGPRNYRAELRAAAVHHAAVGGAWGANPDPTSQLVKRRHQARALYAWHRARIHAGQQATLPRRIWDYLASPEL